MGTARQRILDAAETRLLARGPGGLVLDSIAADTGLSKGGLLYRLLLRMIELAEPSLHLGILALPARPLPRGRLGASELPASSHSMRLQCIQARIIQSVWHHIASGSDMRPEWDASQILVPKRAGDWATIVRRAALRR
jgi:hypothetical protein